MSNPFQSAARSTIEQASLSPDDDDERGDELEAEIEQPAATAAAASSSPHRSRSPPNVAGSPAPAASSLPPEDLNAATAARIRSAMGRTSVFPDKIVAERTANGPFTSLADLKKRVAGLGKVKLKLLSDGGLTIGPLNSQPQPTQSDPVQPTPAQPQFDPLLIVSQPIQPAQPEPQPLQPVQPAEPVASVAVAPGPQPSTQQTQSEADSLPISAPLLLPAASSSSSSSTSVSIASPPAPPAEMMQEVVVQQDAAIPSAAPAVQPQPSSASGCWSHWLCCAPADTPTKPTRDSQPQPSPPAPAPAPPAADPTLAQIEVQLASMSIQAQLQAPAPSGASGSASRPPYSAPSLRVGSWNLCHFNATKGRNAAVMSVVSDVLVRQRFDVAVLIEVRCKEVCDILLTEYLNNPARVIPPGNLPADAANNEGVGRWKYELSECMEYGSEAHSIANGLGSAQPELVLEADIIEESTHAHSNGIVHETTHSTARLEQSSAQLQPTEHEDDDITASLTTLTINEHTRTVVSDGAGLAATSMHVSSSFTSASMLQTPVKNRNSQALSPPEHHHRRSSGGSSGSARKSHSKKEYCAVFYRADRVELPQGCRLFQSKAGSAAARNNSSDDSPSAYQWWRSPCCVLVRPLPALLREHSIASSSDPVSWMLVALHVIWGNGESDIVRECSHLQQLYSSVLSEIQRDAAASNTAVALLGDFNLSYHSMEFQRHCLSLDRFAALVSRPACSTFSQKKADCNLYDQVFAERAVMDALLPADHAVSADVVYFDRTYFPVDVSSASAAPSSPPLDPASLAAAAAMKSRMDAKRISDHRPVYSDLPCTGNVRGVASSVVTEMAPVPATPPKAAPAPLLEAGLGSAAASSSGDATASSDASSVSSSDAPARLSPPIPPLSSLLSIVVVTSAIPIHPATTVIDSVLHSFTLMPELAGLHTVIMCDYPKKIVDDSAANGAEAARSSSAASSSGLPPDAILYKRGVISSSRFAAYRQYIAALRAKYASRPEIEIVELPSYHGFAHCVKDALIRYVNTPYVLVAQHDYIFMLSAPIRELVAAMYASHSWKHRAAAAAAAASSSQPPPQYPAPPSPLNYIGFTHKRSQNYLELVKRNMPPALAADPMLRLYEAPVPAAYAAAASPSRLLLSPLMFQYDKPHLASVRYLLEDVLMHPRLQPMGTFIEDEFGVEQIEEIRARAAAISKGVDSTGESAMQLWARKFGTYLFFHDSAGLRINLKHIHGRRFEQQKLGGMQRFIPPESSNGQDASEAAGDDSDDDTKARLDLFRME